MPYIGRSSNFGVRTRFLYTATASQTTFSGTDTQNLTLSYSDSNFIDVHQNGVLLKVVDDYTATSGTSVVLATGATANDVIEITVYDVFSIANHIKKTGDAMAGALTNIDIDGTELILDADGDTSITADTDDQIDFKIGGTDVMAMSTTGLTITTADNTTQLTLKSTDADSNLGPILDLLRDGGSPADSDFIGQVRFQAKDDGGNIHEYAKIFGQIADVTGGTEDGILNIRTVLNGTDTRRIDLGVTETVFNEDSADLDFRIESDGNTHALFLEGSTGNIGIGTSSPSSQVDGAANLVIGGTSDADTGMTFVTSTSGQGLIHFSDATSGNARYDGFIGYEQNNQAMKFGTAQAERMRISSGGDVTISDGDLVIGTAGHGINFAATSDASGMTSELLDDYEEGTWTPTLPQGGTVNIVVDAHYIKIGSLVAYYMYAGFTPTNNSSYFRIGGIPYTPIQNNHGGGSIQYAQTLNVQHWSGPLAHHDGYIYFHRLDGNSAVIANSEFGGSQYNLILHGVYTIL